MADTVIIEHLNDMEVSCELMRTLSDYAEKLGKKYGYDEISLEDEEEGLNENGEVTICDLNGQTGSCIRT